MGRFQVEIEGYETARLRIAQIAHVTDDDLDALFAPKVVAELPPFFAAAKTPHERRAVLQDLGQECDVFGISDASGVVGLLLLSPEEATRAFRLGYYFKETAWGNGYASECLGGLQERCRALGIGLIGGVAHTNHASRRVLEKRGFLVEDKAASVLEYTWFP
jgi:RimJ/RimL family protein N-acetyltransferase